MIFESLIVFLQKGILHKRFFILECRIIGINSAFGFNDDRPVNCSVFTLNDQHDLGNDHAACGSEGESHAAEDQDTDGLQREELVSRELGAHSDTEEDGHDVAESIGGSVAQTADNTGFFHQVTEHQHTDQRSGIGKQQSAEQSDEDGEADLFDLAHGAELGHTDLAFSLGGQQLHDGGLDDGHESHVAVSGHGNSTQKVGAQAAGQEDGGGHLPLTLPEYYEARGWVNAFPTDETLKKLGLDECVGK